MERINRPLKQTEATQIKARHVVRVIDYDVEPLGGHMEIVYQVLAQPENIEEAIQCKSCSKPSMFWQWSRDHWGQIFITGVCQDHAPERFINLANSKDL